MAITWTKHDEIEYYGLSTDTKPTASITIGSRFNETDTGNKYKFDGSSWTMDISHGSHSGVAERTMANVLKKLNTDSSGRLRVSAESVASHAVTLSSLANVNLISAVSTVSAVANITNWGLFSATSKSQIEAFQAYQQGYRRNLVHS